mgnify:CR=1 FL=1
MDTVVGGLLEGCMAAAELSVAAQVVEWEYVQY